jgi:SEC-C motif-containing protein
MEYTMSLCPCNSTKPYDECCGPVIDGTRDASTAEELMRARYTAYTRVEMDFLLSSLHPDKRGEHDTAATTKWARSSEWLGLDVLSKDEGGAGDEKGWVEFKAIYRQKGVRHTHHEIAEFRKQEGTWFFYDGSAAVPETYRRSAPKVGRNDPCPCGSGKKYKKCCGKA